MASVWIPSLMRGLTGGQARVTMPGTTVGDVIDALDNAYPGVRDRLCPGGKLDPAIRASVDGRIALLGLLEPVGKESEVLFVPAVAGG